MFPDSVAVEDGHVRRTSAQLLGRAEHLANALDELGIPSGAAVGVLSGNRSAYVEADAAIALGRRVRVAFNARLHLDDFRYAAQDAGLAALFHSSEFEEEALALRDETGLIPISFDAPVPGGVAMADLIDSAPGHTRLRDNDPEGPAWISYTSGTTGRPKGVVLSHRAVREVALNLLLELGPVRPGEQIVLTQPISHGAGYFVLPYLMCGAGVYVMRTFDPELVWRLSEDPRRRTLKAVPSMIEPILAAEPRGARWGYRSLVYGASGIPQATLTRALERFGPTLMQDYGQSEAPVTITCLQRDDHLEADARFSAGRPWKSVAVEVRDEAGELAEPGQLGEVYVQGRHQMSGYHNRPQETADVMRDGWIRTRDMAVVDERGFVYLRGRRDEMIVTGGFNVAPREVEDVIGALEGIDEVVVLGMPDERWGDAVTAVIRPSRGANPATERVIELARPRLGIRTPKRVVVWDEIPRNPYGKVDRMAIRSRLSEEAEQ